jgi:hypothetical protein
VIEEHGDKVGKNKVPSIAKGLQHPLGLPKQDASAPSTVTEPAPPVVRTSVPLDEHASSAEPIAAPRHRNLATPLVTKIFGTDDVTMAPLQDVLENIAKEFLFGKLGNIVVTATGYYDAAAPLNVLKKLEAFLQILSKQRTLFCSLHPDVSADAVFTKDQMRLLHQEWMHDYPSWMNSDNIKLYEGLQHGTATGEHQKAHQKLRQSFSAFLFQIIGNKHVLLASIQHPLLRVPASIQQFIKAWEKEKSSDEYKKQKHISECRTEDRKALKKAAHQARQDLVKARKIHTEKWENLSKEDKNLWINLQSGKLDRICNACDQAFGWNQQMRTNTGSTASRIVAAACQQLPKA